MYSLADTPIQLTAAEAWMLYESSIAVEDARAVFRAAERRKTMLVERLAHQYGFDPAANLSFDDRAGTLRTVL